MQRNPFPMGLWHLPAPHSPHPSPWGQSPRARLCAHHEGCSLPALRLPPDKQSCHQDPQQKHSQSSDAPGTCSLDAGEPCGAHPAHGTHQYSCKRTTAAHQGSVKPIPLPRLPRQEEQRTTRGQRWMACHGGFSYFSPAWEAEGAGGFSRSCWTSQERAGGNQAGPACILLPVGF